MRPPRPFRPIPPHRPRRPPPPASPAVGARPGALAPEFSLPDAAGKTHALSAYRGKWVVLEWVNYDCPFVRKHYGSGNMQKTQAAAKAKGAVWLSINSSAPGKQGNFAGTELTKRIVDSKAAMDAYLLDPDGAVGKAYKAKTTPHMFVIDPAGEDRLCRRHRRQAVRRSGGRGRARRTTCWPPWRRAWRANRWKRPRRPRMAAG